MPPIDAFRLSDAAARKYQDHSVPAMFAPLAEATVERLELPADGHILDVACGTGALTRVILQHLPGKGRVVGADLNQSMLDIAQSLTTQTNHRVDWVASDVTALPLDAHSFDLACIQQGLQFFPDKPAALAEIYRVLKPGGRLCLTCWRAISPFNDALAEALAIHVGDDAAQKARAPFSFRDGDIITNLLRQAGYSIALHDGIILQRRFEDLRAQVLALPVEQDMREKGEAVIDLILDDISTRLAPYAQDGVFIVPQEAHFFVATRP
ncbi:class I SAM-dependent methyltransferase [Ruegeria atlantica]|uniref:class I SAM-dependent methyltransferase n=1 Tax=Ruegeria atlantica TaxID=81569 RepID=UPI00147E83A5|nr:methyltransferase domain-containing protein [Ruegeria atlantica]